MTDTVVVEGQVKFRDGKKWKSRWVVLRKPSPVADCLSLQVFKGRKKKKERGSGHKERLNVTLEGICGVEPAAGYDGVAYTLSILCLGYSLTLGFHSREALAAWDARLRYSLGEVHRFSVTIQPGTKLESGSASLHLCNNLLVLARDPPPPAVIIGHWKLPPAVIGQWKLSELRRYGAVPHGFVFEGGTRCGYWAGVFFLSCAEGEQISFLFDCIVRGISPTRTPFGVQPALPVDPSAKPSSSEEQINEEASELEKRLSMLSQCSRPSSTASTYSGSTSVGAGGDDHSSVSSSSSSQSDASYGGSDRRLHMMWVPEAAAVSSGLRSSSYRSTDALSAGGPPTSAAVRTNTDERLYAAVMGSAAIGPTLTLSTSSSSSKGQQLRGLLDSGRQSSLDSGIGIVASGSQSSSISGSFSSYTGSLDTASQGGGGEEFGSVASLPTPPPPPPPHPPPLPPVDIPQRHSANNNTSCSSCSSRPSSSASSSARRRHSEEYQSPSMLMLQYDVPRRLVQGLKDAPAGGQGLKDAPAGGQGLGPTCHSGPAERRATMQRSLSWGSERAPSVASVERCCTPRPALLLTDGAVCEMTQCSPDVDNYITAEQWRSARNRGLTEVTNLPESESSQPSAHTPDICLFVREPGDGDGSSDASRDAGSALERPEESSRRSYLPASTPPPPPPCTLSLQRRPSAPGQRSSYEQTDVSKRRDLRLDEYRTFLQSSHEAPTSFSPATRLYSSNSANYVNIPISPMAAKASRELLYMELDLHERRFRTTASTLSPGANAVREGGSIRYAHINLAAMERAQRVGAEHAQGREDRLPQLEGRRRAAPN